MIHQPESRNPQVNLPFGKEGTSKNALPISQRALQDKQGHREVGPLPFYPETSENLIARPDHTGGWSPRVVA